MRTGQGVWRTKYDFNDIHDRVNYSIRNTQVSIDSENRVIRFACKMDDALLSKSFEHLYVQDDIVRGGKPILGCRFEFLVNGMLINNTPVRPAQPPVPPPTGQETVL